MSLKRQLHNLVEFANARLQPQLVAWRESSSSKSLQITLQLLETYEWLDFGTKLGFFEREEATRLAIESFFPTFADSEACFEFLPAPIKFHLDATRRTKQFFLEIQDVDSWITEGMSGLLESNFDALAQISTSLVTNPYFNTFQLASRTLNTQDWESRIRQPLQAVLANDDDSLWSKLNISLKVTANTAPSEGVWWDAFRGFLTAIEYIEDQRDILTELELDQGTSSACLPFSRRIEHMERWKMDFRGSQVFSDRFEEIRDLVGSRAPNFQKYVEGLQKYWINRGAATSAPNSRSRTTTA